MSEVEAPEVTFVGGRAIEQSEGLDSNLEPDERDAAKEAVRKAIQEAGESSAKEAKSGRAQDPYKPPGAKSEKDSGKDSEEKGASDTPERGTDGKFLPKNPSGGSKDSKANVPARPAEGSEEEELDFDKASVKQLLKAREKVAAIKREAKDESSKREAEFQAREQAFQRQQAQFAQAQAQLRQQYESLQALKKDPARAIRELGQDPEEFILNLAQEGTPEGQAKRQYRELQQKLDQMEQWKAAQERQTQERLKQAHEQQVAQGRQNAIQQFVNLGMDEEKYPHTASAFKGKEKVLVAWGDLAAEEYRTLSRGREGSLEDILDYIEDQLAETGNTWYSKRGNAPSKSQKVEETPKPKSKGKTLNPTDSGERRTLTPKSLRDLDGDERLEAARQAVSVALANSKQD